MLTAARRTRVNTTASALRPSAHRATRVSARTGSAGRTAREVSTLVFLSCHAQYLFTKVNFNYFPKKTSGLTLMGSAGPTAREGEYMGGFHEAALDSGPLRPCECHCLLQSQYTGLFSHCQNKQRNRTISTRSFCPSSRLKHPVSFVGGAKNGFFSFKNNARKRALSFPKEMICCFPVLTVPNAQARILKSPGSAF